MNNREALKTLIKSHGIRRREAARMLCVPISTLNNWLLPDTSKASRKVKPDALKSLRRELSIREILDFVDMQAKDESLWFTARTLPEDYLQEGLRKLHALIEHEFKH